MAMSPRLLVPRATGFNPKSIPGLALWLDAQASNTLFDAETGGSPTAADGEVGRWVDKSGNTRNVTQGTPNNRPRLKTGIVNGRNVLRFDGSNDLLEGVTATSDLPFPYSLFVVYQSSDTAGALVAFNRISGGNFFEGLRKSAANTFQGIQQNGAPGDGITTVSAADASWHVGEIVFSGTSASLTFTVRVNGGATGNMTTARARDATALDRKLQIGAAFVTSGSDFLSGDIAEIIGYGRTLSASELSLVRQYLGSRYAITVTP